MKKITLSIAVLFSLLLFGCDKNGGLITPDYRDKWMGNYQCQYGCVHSYAEGMDTANFVYTAEKSIAIKKRDESVSGIIFSNSPGLRMGVDSSGALQGRYKGRFTNDSLYFYLIESGQPGYWFHRYKCTKIWPYRLKR